MANAGDSERENLNTYGFDPALENVRTRRVFAFLIDYAVVVLLYLLALVPVFILGIITLGIGWLLYLILAPLIAMAYIGITISGPYQATPGMRMFSIALRRNDGQPIDFYFAILHGVLFWALHIVLTPVLLVVSLFTERKQLLHDILLGTTVVRSDI